jgi:hypothetical protein
VISRVPSLGSTPFRLARFSDGSKIELITGY